MKITFNNIDRELLDKVIDLIGDCDIEIDSELDFDTGNTFTLYPGTAYVINGSIYSFLEEVFTEDKEPILVFQDAKDGYYSIPKAIITDYELRKATPDEWEDFLDEIGG